MIGLTAKIVLVANINYLAFYRRLFDVLYLFEKTTQMKVGDLQNTGRMPQLKITDSIVIYLGELILYFCTYKKRNNEIKTMMIQCFRKVSP